MLKWIKSFLQGMLLFLLPMDGPILQPDDHHILRYYAAIRRVVRPTMHQVFKLLRPNDARTLKELVFSIEGYSQTKYKKQFDERERQRLDNNEPSETYDISLLYKLLQLVCNLASSSDTKWNESGTLEYFLKQMKNERNILAHEDICFAFDELQRRVVFLEDICHNALVAAGQRSGQSVEGDIDNMKTKMEEVLVGGIGLWEPYREALKDLRNKQSNVLVRVGRKDLTKLAQKLRILNPFAWLLDDNYSHLDIEHIFTRLTIQGKEDIQMEELLVTTLQSGDIPDVTILSGPPGIGKTSLLRFMVQDGLSFHPTMQGLENVDLLLPVELRHVVSDNAKDLVIELLPSVSQHLQNEDIFIALNNISVVWLLDGFDEASLEVRKVIKELLKKSPNSKFLITTRTEYTQEIEKVVRSIHRSSLTVNIKGFSIADIEICAKKLIDVYEKKVDERAAILNKFMKFCKEGNYSPQWEIFTVPLLLTISLTLWLDSQARLSNIETMSALYNFLVDHIIQKLIARESFSHLRVKERNSTLHKKINEFLDVLGFILLKDEREYTLQENEVDLLEEKCKDLEIPFKDTMSAFFVFSEVETASGIKEEYTIIHRTLKEFLSARAFCNQMITKGWDVMTTAGNWIQRTRDTLKYDTCRLDLCNRYNLENLDMEKPSDNYVNDSWKILEVNNSSLVRQYIELCLHCFSIGDFREENNAIHFMEKVTGPSRSRSYWYHIKGSLHREILKYIIGYLCVKQEMNPSRAEQLDFVAHKLMKNNSVDFQYVYSLLKEGSSSQFSMEFSKFLQKVLWSFMFINIEPLFYAELLLQYVTPDDIHLHYCVGRENPWEFLIKSIQTVKMCHSDIHLDLRNIFACPNSDKELIKGCLKELLHETAVARLVTLHSPLNKEGIKLLETAAYLKEISIKVSAYDLPVAAEVLGKLPSLQILRIAVDAANYGSLDHPNLNVRHENLSDFVIVLLETYQLQPQVVGEMLNKISPYSKHVILSGSVFSITEDRFLNYVTFIKSNLRFVKQIDFMFDITAESFGIFFSYRDLGQYLKHFHPDVVIQVKGYDNLGNKF